MSSPEPSVVIEKLLTGNKRFIAGRPAHPIQTAEKRVELAAGQHPFAVIVGCSDSRVAPERIFDRRQGELFVVRTAGHVLDDVVLGSVEYAVEYLDVSLVLVLGHRGCGAVAAALAGRAVEGHVAMVLAAVRMAVSAGQAQPGDPLDNAVRASIRHTVQALQASSPALARRVGEGKLEIHGAYYDLVSGTVEILP